MLRRAFPRSLALIAAIAGALIATSAAAASTPEPRTDVNNFSFSLWDATYEVGIDDDGRATLHVEETRVAEFPDIDQNRGIVAGYPQTYEGADIDTTILSVRDENGDEIPYKIEEDDDMLYLLTGDDDYVHGPTTYVIEYEMRDVILAATDTQVDEFYWDLLPLDSTQFITKFRAEIIFGEELAPHLTGDSSCYRGRAGSTTQCNVIPRGDALTVTAMMLTPGQTVTVAIALDAGTITQPPTRQRNPVTDVWPYAAGVGAVLFSIGAWITTAVLIRSRRRGTGIIVAQYDVPDSMPPLLSQAIVPKAKNAITAQIVHLAVRGLLRIEEVPESGETTTPPRLRRLDGTATNALDEQAMTALFTHRKPGDVKTLPYGNKAFIARMEALTKAGKTSAEAQGLTTTARSTLARVLQCISLAGIAVMTGMMLWGMFLGRESAGYVLFPLFLCATFVLFASFKAFRTHTVLSPAGALQWEYLQGVREFIRVAEADRLQMLQSYNGAERRSDGTVDVIHLYERLLPYAILFGQENEWGEVLESAYEREQHSPGWVNGAWTGFAVRMLTFSAATASSPRASGAGGAFGGGFAGGGGGGGFSGGR